MNESERIDAYQRIDSAAKKLVSAGGIGDDEKRDHFREWVDSEGSTELKALLSWHDSGEPE